MKNYKLNTGAGDRFETVAKNAKEFATEKSFTVEFDFNGINCIVTKDTNLDWLYKDYCNAHIMEWKEVTGVGQYSDETNSELELRNRKSQEASEKRQEEYNRKANSEKALMQEKTKGVEIELIEKADWETGKEKNSDPYGSCVYEYAEGWAKLMQVEISKGKELKDIAQSTSYEMGFLGITGFMYGAAVSILSHCWVHGEQLRKWHNKEYNHEGEGVVNPAILTIKS